MKVDKSKLITTDKSGNPFKNGAKYQDITITVFDEPDKYGNNCSITISQTKEERESKAEKTYLGNGKVVFESNKEGRRPVTPDYKESDEDDLPF